MGGVEVKWSTWGCGRKGCYEDKRIDDEYEVDRYAQTDYTCLQNLPTSQPTWSILVAQLCIPIEVLT